MKVIMLSDVRGVGKKGEVVEVADGYAKNFLIRQKKAVACSTGSRRVLEQQKEQARTREEEAKRQAEEKKKEIEKLTLVFPVHTGKEGKAFGSVSTKQITEELEKKHGISVDKRKFLDTENLDAIGFHHVRVELHKGVVAVVKVQLVEAE